MWIACDVGQMVSLCDGCEKPTDLVGLFFVVACHCSVYVTVMVFALGLIDQDGNKAHHMTGFVGSLAGRSAPRQVYAWVGCGGWG